MEPLSLGLMVLGGNLAVMFSSAASHLGQVVVDGICRLLGRDKDSKMWKDLAQAIEKGNVEPMLQKYDDQLSQVLKDALVAVVELRRLLQNAKTYVTKRMYTKTNGDEFIQLAKALHNLTADIGFKEIGIKELKVKDSKGNEFKVTNKEYFTALLLRYAASVWTHLARKITPGGHGWAINYDQHVRLVIAKPGKLMRGGTYRGTLDPEYRRFRAAYKDLMAIYDEAIKIRETYLKAVQCFRTAKLEVQVAQQAEEKQAIHEGMEPQQLDALALAFLGEAQYWLFQSEKLPKTITILKPFLENKRKLGEQYLAQLKIGEEEQGAFLDCLDLYASIEEGLAGALSFYQQAVELCDSGPVKTKLEQRIAEIRDRAAGTPVIYVEDPKPFF